MMSCIVEFLSSLISLCMRVFLVNNCSFSRLITKYDNVLLQFTTVRLITNYDNLLLQFTITWLLQFSTTGITSYYSYYNSRQNRVTLPSKKEASFGSPFYWRQHFIQCFSCKPFSTFCMEMYETLAHPG